MGFEYNRVRPARNIAVGIVPFAGVPHAQFVSGVEVFVDLDIDLMPIRVQVVSCCYRGALVALSAQDPAKTSPIETIAGAEVIGMGHLIQNLADVTARIDTGPI